MFMNMSSKINFLYSYTGNFITICNIRVLVIIGRGNCVVVIYFPFNTFYLSNISSKYLNFLGVFEFSMTVNLHLNAVIVVIYMFRTQKYWVVILGFRHHENHACLNNILNI